MRFNMTILILLLVLSLTFGGFMVIVSDNLQGEIYDLEDRLFMAKLNHNHTKNQLSWANEDVAEYQDLYFQYSNKVDELMNTIEFLNQDVYDAEVQLLYCYDARMLGSTRNTFDDDRVGSYYSATMDIELYLGGLSKKEANIVALHEVGHYVWYELMRSSDRREWLTKFESETEFVTDYAKTNVEEYFAESYAYNFFGLD